ncbi:hypothetical protein HOY80DRAFT_1024830 [Tuber brumale]|nr:hypothetical protein HOY80DRAFT_1024830 [Tuber brumale]
MPVPYCLSSRFTDSDSDSNPEDLYFHETGSHVRIRPTSGRNANEILGGEDDDELKCEKCDTKFLSEEALHRHMLKGKGKSKNGAEKHFYCGKCRLDFNNEEGLKAHMVESSKHVFCRECSLEFQTPEELDLHCKQVHDLELASDHRCPGCGTLFNAISGISQHIESGQCQGQLSPGEFRELINYENNPLAKKHLPANILAGSTTTHIWRAGILPQRVKASLALTSSGSKPDELAPKDFVSVIDYSLPTKPESQQPFETLRNCWNDIVKAYVCPRPRCGRKFNNISALKAHLQSVTHDKKAFRCPTCVECFVSSSGLLQHAESGACGVKSSPAYQQLIKGATGGLMDGIKKGEFKTGW